MRRLTQATVAASVASILLLAGCSGDGDAKDPATPAASATPSAPAEAEPTAADIKALDAVTMEGEPGAQPTVTFTSPLTVTAPVARLVENGKGAKLSEGQFIELDFVAVGGADGKEQGSTYEAEPDHFTLGPTTIFPALNDVLTGQNVGARFLFAVPDATTTTVMAVEVTAAELPGRAKGEAVAPEDGLPTVELAENGAPTITPAKGDAPSDLVVQPLIKGDGAKVTKGQTVEFQYAGVLWDGTPFDASWNNGEAFESPIGVGKVVPGWDEGLVGQTVGSQVLLVVPPALGYGDEGREGIPAKSTLVFVVDILEAK